MNVRDYKGTDQKFMDACLRAGVRPTHRQWRKWVNKRGSAFAAR